MDSHLPVLFVVAAVLAAAGCKHSKEEMPVKPVAASAPAPVTAQAAPKAAAPQAQPVAPPTVSPAAEKRIGILKTLVARDPTDVKSWIALGNEYFDSQQREKAIEAYDKALQLQPNNPDVLTDQGVMYREIGQPQKAVQNFEKASTINPKHLQSLLDLGVVYGKDLKDYDKAMEAFNRIIKIAPDSGEAAHAREAIEELKHTPHISTKE
ncbi:MAG TPA: tetratricopeptide repeat protein [Myxococcales bacterium]